jgi:hypothetical protein
MLRCIVYGMLNCDMGVARTTEGRDAAVAGLLGGRHAGGASSLAVGAMLPPRAEQWPVDGAACSGHHRCH